MESMWCHCQLLSISSMREVFLRSSASSGRSMHYYFSSPALSRVNSHPQPYFMPHAPEVVWLSSLMRTETALLKAWDTCGVLKHSFLEQNDWPLLFSRVLVLCKTCGCTQKTAFGRISGKYLYREACMVLFSGTNSLQYNTLNLADRKKECVVFVQLSNLVIRRSCKQCRIATRGQTLCSFKHSC